MRLSFAAQRLLAVVAHPDDVELLCAGTLARAKADGAAIGMCTLCRGDKGGRGDREKVSRTRKREFNAAASLLGAETFFGNVADGELVDSPDNRRKLIRIMRRFQPTVLLAHDPEDYHADHRAAAALCEAASWFACSPGHASRQSPLAQPPALLWMDTVNMLGFQPGFYVDVSDQLPLKIDMLSCHKSQLGGRQNTVVESLQEVMMRQTSVRGAQAGVEAAEAFRIHAAWRRVRAW